MNDSRRVGETAENAQPGKETGERKELRAWVSEQIQRDGKIDQALKDGCHCKQSCGAWYNLD